MAGATLGASALFASAAQAAIYTVNSNADDAPGGSCSTTCTLRDALSTANNDTSGTDTIAFASNVTGTITLTNGALPISGDVPITIAGPGSGKLTVSGGGSSQVFQITSAAKGEAINGLTLTDGSSSNPGGAVTDTGSASTSSLSLTDDAITDSSSTNADGGGGIFTEAPITLTGTEVSGNHALDGDGGGIATDDENIPVKVTNSVISGNYGLSGGGIGAGFTSDKYGASNDVAVSDSKLTGNHATGTGSGQGNGGAIAGEFNTLALNGTVVSGNTATSGGGGIDEQTVYGATITGSTISENTAAAGGGGVQMNRSDTKYEPLAPLLISDTTISGNGAINGAGVDITALDPGNSATILASTISGNHGGASSFGGGLHVTGNVSGPIKLVDSTVSGNTATTGGAVSLGDTGHTQLFGTADDADGSVSFDDSTISGNAAASKGGGIYLGEYSSGSPAAEHSGTVGIRGTIVSGNTSAGAAEDLERAAGSTSGGFDGALSLVQTPGSAPFVSKQSVITGVNPQLGALANNGGPTQTMLPSGTSPVIDQGRAFDDVSTDQRGDPRTVVNGVPEPPGGDGTDIGSVELPASSVKVNFTVVIDHRGLGGTPPPVLAGASTPVQCRVRLGTISSCVVSVRAGNKLLATGTAAPSRPRSQTTLHVQLTKAGVKMLRKHRLGVRATVDAVASAPGSPSSRGTVRLLAGPSFTLPTGGSGLSKKVRGELKQIASILKGVKTVKCVAFASKGGAASGQAKAACKRLKKDGLKATYSSAGNGGAKGSKQRLVIKFKF